MADNVTANAGSGGAVFATDDVAGVHYPLVKLAYGALDTATLVTGAAGLPVDTELPAAAALGDADANPTTVQVGACLQLWNTATSQWQRLTTGAGDASGSGQKIPGVQFAFNGTNFDRLRTVGVGDGFAGTGVLAVGGMIFNGTNYDRLRGDAANGLDVDVTRLPALPAGTNNIGDVDVLTLPALPAGTNNIGDVDVLSLPALPAGSNTIGAVALKPTTSGGTTPHKKISAASTNATSLKASAGQLYSIAAFNLNAAARFLKIYDKASAPTVGTDTPVLTFLLPGNTAGAGFTTDFAAGIAFANGIAYALTTGIADTDTGAVAANEIVINLAYA